MKVFIVHAHPEPRSFNAALTRTAVQALEGAGHQVQVSDLYAQRFDPVSGRHNFTTVQDPEFLKLQQEELLASQQHGFVPELRAEQEKLDWCDALVFQFPLWWFGLPAILKGWVDRVFAMGRIYGGGRFYDRGVFRGKRALCSVTTGGPELSYSPRGLQGDIQQILFPVNHGIFFFTGFTPLPPFLVFGAARMTEEQRHTHLTRYQETVLRLMDLEPLHYPGLDDHDENLQRKGP